MNTLIFSVMLAIIMTLFLTLPKAEPCPNGLVKTRGTMGFKCVRDPISLH